VNDNHRDMLENVFLEIGIEEGQEILDFGCGSGYYTIPVAEVVGNKGTVYAVDKQQKKLEELKKNLNSSGQSNVRVFGSTGGTGLQFPDGSMDVVLLYDIFSYYGPASKELVDLLDEVRRVLQEDGFLSVFPKHVDIGDLKTKIERANFVFRDMYSGTLLHYGSPEEGCLLNYEKR